MEEEYKGYLISSCDGTMKCIKVIGKGSVIKALRGLYTSNLEARRAIDAVIDVKERKSNGKAKSTD